MKPELKAIHAAVLSQFNLPENLVSDVAQTILLAALHWRGDELWCGPLQVGKTNRRTRGDRFVYGWFLPATTNVGNAGTLDQARAALETAAWEQINAWFKDQTE